MKLLTLLALVIVICGIFLNSGQSEETSKVDNTQESIPENDVTNDETDEIM